MIASSAARWAIRGRPVAAGGSDSASSGATTAHSASGTRQIGGSAGRAFFGRAITHLPRVVPHDLFPSEIDTKQFWEWYRSGITAATRPLQEPLPGTAPCPAA